MLRVHTGNFEKAMSATPWPISIRHDGYSAIIQKLAVAKDSVERSIITSQIGNNRLSVRSLNRVIEHSMMQTVIIPVLNNPHGL